MEYLTTAPNRVKLNSELRSGSITNFRFPRLFETIDNDEVSQPIYRKDIIKSIFEDVEKIKVEHYVSPPKYDVRY